MSTYNLDLLGSGGFGLTVRVDNNFARMVNDTSINEYPVVKIFKSHSQVKDDFKYEIAQLKLAQSAGLASYFIKAKHYRSSDSSKFSFTATNRDAVVRMRSSNLYCIFMKELTPISKDEPEQNLLQMKSDLYKEIKQLHTHGIYHMDIKPDNIMKMGDNYTLIDYGLASKSITDNGTPYYMSPALIHWTSETFKLTSRPYLGDMYNQVYFFKYRRPASSALLASPLRALSIDSYKSLERKLTEKNILEKNDEFALALSLEETFPTIIKQNYDQGGGKPMKSSSARARAKAISSSREQSMANSSSKSSPKTSRNKPKTARDKAISSSFSKLIIM